VSIATRAVRRADETKETMMRFVAIYRTADVSTPPTPEQYEAMGRYISEAVAAGVLLATEGFGPSQPADAKMRLHGGQITVVDGPFAETKEAIGGFAVMQTRTREEMLEWTRRFLLIAGDGESEIRQLHDMSPLDQVKA
jgi:hypothetical protein